MNRVEAVALRDFVHNDIDAREGRVVRHRDGTLIDAATAADLERDGHVRIRTTSRGANPMQPDPAATTEAGKASDDGRGQPSSVSPPAPASPPLTSASLKTGSAKTRRDGA